MASVKKVKVVAIASPSSKTVFGIDSSGVLYIYNFTTKGWEVPPAPAA